MASLSGSRDPLAYDIEPADTESVLRRRETVTGNPLAIDIIYVQRFTLTRESNKDEFQKNILQYADKMLNDTDFGIVFFKARVFNNTGVKRETEASIGSTHGLEYILHFHAFDEESLSPPKIQVIEEKFLPLLITGANGEPLAKLESTDLIIHTDTSLRKPVYIPPTEGTDDDGQPTPERNCCQKFLDFWLVVPRVQWDFFNLIYQLYTFDVTHQGFIPKFVHFFTIPINILLFFMFFAQFKLPGSYIEDTSVRRGPFIFPTNWSYLPLGVLLLLYIVMGFLRKCKTWGFATAVVITMLWGVGNLFYQEVRIPRDAIATANATGIYREHWLNPVYLPYNPLIWSYIVSLIQATSHMIVPEMPPYISGVSHWENFHTWLWKYNGEHQCIYKCLALVCFPVLSVSVAYFSWPHLIGTEVFYIMAGIGYNHSYFEKYKLVTTKAELSGNPRVSCFPSSANDLMNDDNPYRRHLKAHKIVSDDDAKNKGKVAKAVASYHIYNAYFRGRHMATTNDKDEREAHIYHYKAVGEHYFSRQH